MKITKQEFIQLRKSKYFNILMNAIDLYSSSRDRNTKIEIKEFIDSINDSIDFTEFSYQELIGLGFGKWEDDLLLSQPWVLNFCKKGTVFTSISNDTKIFGKDEIDTDTRFGYTAYGFSKSQLRDSKIEEIINE